MASGRERKVPYSAAAAAAEEDVEGGKIGHESVIRSNTPRSKFGRFTMSAWTELGRRKVQEDRLCCAPRLSPSSGFFGVFDGTVGPEASHYVHLHLLDNLLRVEGMDKLLKIEDEETLSRKEVVEQLAYAVRDSYLRTDADLIRVCAEGGHDYASSTSVTALITGNLMTLAHLGDSRIVLGRSSTVPDVGTVHEVTGHLLTRDHKPDQADEHRRIVEAGGSLTYLHRGKPFIRGGDFTARQARGDRPMQLNYSRAFGGKDLKPYGLSAEPTVRSIMLTDIDRLVIVASDGLWDVVDATTAVRLAINARLSGDNPSQVLCTYALRQHDIRGSVDNVTVVVIEF